MAWALKDVVEAARGVLKSGVMGKGAVAAGLAAMVVLRLAYGGGGTQRVLKMLIDAQAQVRVRLHVCTPVASRLTSPYTRSASFD